MLLYELLLVGVESHKAPGVRGQMLDTCMNTWLFYDIAFLSLFIKAQLELQYVFPCPQTPVA